MATLEEIVGQHINYALERTSHLPDNIYNIITNKEIKLKDYQYLVSRVFIGLKTLNSILLFWDTGMGKTLTAVYIMKHIKELFPKWIILIFIKKSLYLDPWLNTIRSYFGDLNNIIFIHYDSSSSITKFNNIYRSIEISLNKKNRVLIIIDEVHKLISRTVKKDDKIRQFDSIFKKIIKLSNFENNKLLCMSATPVTNTIQEFNNLISLMRNNVLYFNESYIVQGKILYFKELRKGLYGLCSYKRLIEADSLTNTIYTEGFASKTVFYPEIVMSEEQSNLYNRAEIYDFKSELGGLKTMRRLVSSFAFYDLKTKGDFDSVEYNKYIKKKLKTFIEITDKIKFSPEFINQFKSGTLSSYSSIDDVNNYNMLYQYSCKYIEACKIILNSRGKVLLYEPLVSFEGISSLKQYLKSFGISFIEYSNKTIKTRDSDLDEFNNFNNNNGEIIKVCIFSAAGSEGISFKSINDIIILDLPWKESDLKQIIGRSIRLNSHNELDISFRYVNVYIILAISREGKSVDKDILNLIKEKQKNINSLFELLKSISIEHIYNKFKYIEPVDNEFILDTIRNTKIKDINASNVITNIEVTPINYCNEYDKTTIYEGLLNKTNNIIYSDNIAVAKLKLDEKNDPIFFISENKLIFITEDYYE